MANHPIYYFGYGSLVNRDTRPVGEAAWNARLTGWRRVWDHRVPATDDRVGCTSLSIQPTDRAQDGIDGVIVALERDDLPELDAREAGYERLELASSLFVLSADCPPTDTVHVYRSLCSTPADQQHPVLRSYVDCVLAGYQARYGSEGLNHFVSTTDGWPDTLRDDRAQPLYPRAVAIDEGQTTLFETRLASVGVA